MLLGVGANVGKVVGLVALGDALVGAEVCTVGIGVDALDTFVGDSVMLTSQQDVAISLKAPHKVALEIYDCSWTRPEQFTSSDVSGTVPNILSLIVAPGGQKSPQISGTEAFGHPHQLCKSNLAVKSASIELHDGPTV
jgi:hypothetical protein